ncbi:MAG: membrane dipeptidase [Thermoanaerobaculia bacterium]
MPLSRFRSSARFALSTLIVVLLVALLAVIAPPVSATGANVLPSVYEPAGTGGYAALDRALAKLETHRRLLIIGAHPDDEDTSALTLVSRELGGEAAYLSLSRGEGGQNLVGPDLGESLGLLRTQELLAARGIDGARQYFSRAFDFGYTRSLPETLGLWPEKTLLTDAIRIIRRFKPQVIISVFGDDASGGHGQHQAAGHTAYLAFRSSGDAEPGEETGNGPWKAAALFRTGWFNPEAATVSRSLGGIDPWSGLSIQQLAMKSRSQHRSQDMGRLLDLGGRDGKYIFVEGLPGTGGDDLFNGIDTTLPGMAATLGAAGAPVRAALDRAAAEIGAAREAVRPDHLDAAVAPLTRALTALDTAAAACAKSALSDAPPVCDLIAEKIAIGEEALLVASGVAIDAYVDRSELVPGEPVKLTLLVWNAGKSSVRPLALNSRGSGSELANGAASCGKALEGHSSIAAGELVNFDCAFTLDDKAQPTRPYFLQRPRLGALYDWSATSLPQRGEPFGEGPLSGHVELEVAGRPVRLDREAVWRLGDQALGEIRRPLAVVPRLEIRVSPEVVVWPNGGPAPKLTVDLISHLAAPQKGELGFVSTPDCTIATGSPTMPFTISEARGTTSLQVAAPACAAGGTGRMHLTLQATTATGEHSVTGAPLLEYTHIPETPTRGNDGVDLVRADIRLPKLTRVGYVLGASDRVPAALTEIGVPLEILTPELLDAGDLSRYDAIVVGSRAYETDEHLKAANNRLLDYARKGGLVIVQYQQYPFIDGGFAPFTLDIARPHDRITDENAPVRILVADHPAFTTPNRIGPDDWKGWIQERSLYMPSTWAADYSPLLEMQDPDQAPQRGALLVAGLGKGTYVYTGIAFFRELPAGVPGAFRLFANLLALGRSGAEREASFAARGKALADRLMIVDTHIDVPYRLQEEKDAKEEIENISLATSKGEFDYPRAVAGGLDVTFMSIYIPAALQETGGAKALADELIDRVESIQRASPEKWAMAPTPDQALANRKAGRLSFAMGIENGAAIEDNLANVKHFYDRGVRYITLTHGKNNLIGDSSYEPADNRKWHGLSPFGRDVVAEMNRLGILVDISHVSDETFDQALALSKAPPIASHSSCRVFTPGFERNVDDPRIRALAEKGGVLQINFGSSFLTAAANQYSKDGQAAVAAFVKEKNVAADSPEAKAFGEKWQKDNPLPRANLDDVVAQIEHAVAIGGIDHVGLGSDFDGVNGTLPYGLRDVSMYPILFARLLERGWSEADIEKIAGQNLLRVWREAERVAKTLQG